MRDIDKLKKRIRTYMKGKSGISISELSFVLNSHFYNVREAIREMQRDNELTGTKKGESDYWSLK